MGISGVSPSLTLPRARAQTGAVSEPAGRHKTLSGIGYQPLLLVSSLARGRSRTFNPLMADHGGLDPGRREAGRLIGRNRPLAHRSQMIKVSAENRLDACSMAMDSLKMRLIFVVQAYS